MLLVRRESDVATSNESGKNPYKYYEATRPSKHYLS